MIEIRGLRGNLSTLLGAMAFALGLAPGLGVLGAQPVAAQTPLPDLAVSVQWSKFYVLIGSQLSFQVQVNNYGQVAVPANASVRVTLTNGTITGISTAGSGFTCPDANRGPSEAVCRRDTPMAPGTAVFFTVGVRAAAQPGTIKATATGSLPTSLPDRNPSNNSSTSYTQVRAVLRPDLTISVVMGPNPVTGGGPLLCTATVSNVGEGDAAGVRVTNMLPAGARFVKVEASPGFSCTHVSPVVTCTGAAIPAGGTGAIYIDAQAPLQAGSLVYTAAVDPVAGETAAINNTASVTRANLGAPDLIPIVHHQIYDHGYVTPPPGQPLARGVVLAVSVKNQGPGHALATKLRIELRSPGQLDINDSSRASCSLSLGVVATCSIPSLTAGATSGVFEVTASILPGVGPFSVPITFIVKADADGAVAESDEANNLVVGTVNVGGALPPATELDFACRSNDDCASGTCRDGHCVKR